MGEYANLVSHNDREIEELRADPLLAAEYLKATRMLLQAAGDRETGLLMLNALVAAYGKTRIPDLHRADYDRLTAVISEIQQIVAEQLPQDRLHNLR